MPSPAHLSILSFPDSVLFVLLFARMSKGSVLEAFHSQPSTPSSLVLSACSSRAVLFLKTESVRVLSSPLKAGLHSRLNLSVVVYILPLEEPQRAKSSFVDFCSLHLHHRTTNSCCLKSCSLVAVVTGACGERWGKKCDWVTF